MARAAIFTAARCLSILEVIWYWVERAGIISILLRLSCVILLACNLNICEVSLPIIFISRSIKWMGRFVVQRLANAISPTSATARAKRVQLTKFWMERRAKMMFAFQFLFSAIQIFNIDSLYRSSLYGMSRMGENARNWCFTGETKKFLFFQTRKFSKMLKIKGKFIIFCKILIVFYNCIEIFAIIYLKI